MKAGLIGGAIAVAAPLVFTVYLSLTMNDEAQQGVGMMGFAALLAAPTLFLLGAVGGVLAGAMRGRPTTAPVVVPAGNGRLLAIRTRRLRAAGWLLCGALAGHAASALTVFRWPIIGGELIGLALIPIWIWIGATLGHRIAVSQSIHRPLLGGVIAAIAACNMIGAVQRRTMFGINEPAVVGVVALALIDLFAFRGSSAERSPTRDPGASDSSTLP